MRHIGGDEMAVLFQQTLRKAEENKDNKLIIDNSADVAQGIMTETILDQCSLAAAPDSVAYANFATSEGYVRFSSHDESDDFDGLIGRATMQLMEY
jgi:hypothetical protein